MSQLPPNAPGNMAPVNTNSGPNQNVSSPVVGPGPNIAPIGAPVNSSIAGINPNPSNTNAPIPQTSTGSSNPIQQWHQEAIVRIRNLVGFLKESLANLVKVGAMNINHNSHIDNGTKSNEEQLPRFDKALEDFYSICNQIELNLRTVLECAIQTRDSHNYLPFQVSKDLQVDLSQSNLLPDNTMSYPQYLNVIKKQVNYAKAIFDILSDAVKQIKQIEPTQMAQPQHPVIDPSNQRPNPAYNQTTD